MALDTNLFNAAILSLRLCTSFTFHGGAISIMAWILSGLTRSSRSLDTRPLRVFIITSIYSFIACISVIIDGEAVSTREGRLIFCRSGLLKALLACGPSWFLLSVLVPSWSAPWIFGAAFFWFSCSSRLRFCLVRHSTATARVLTYFSSVVVGGSSSWTSLVVAIERVSTMQLFCSGSNNVA